MAVNSRKINSESEGYKIVGTLNRQILCVLMMLLATSVTAQVYKWTDANGQVHYGSKPPVPANVEEIKIDKQKTDVEAVNRLNSMSSSKKTSQTYSSKSSSGSTKNSSAASELEKDKARCKKYKETYARYKKEGVMGINPYTGEKKKMTGEAKKTAIQNAKDNAEIFCD